MVYDPSRSLYERRFRKIRAYEPPAPPEPPTVPVYVADGHAASAFDEIVRLVSQGDVCVEIDACESDHRTLSDALTAGNLAPFALERIRFKEPRPAQTGTTPYEPALAPDAAADEDEAAFFAELEAEESAKGFGDDGDD